jgi:hypothetical protein
VRLFLSYRRGDSAGHTGRLSDSLSARFGADHIFQDVEAVSAGADFVHEIGGALDRCDAVLAVIGPSWATVAGPDGRPRLDDPDDYVRREVAGALQRDLPVVPVLVGGASLPGADALPEDLRPLLRRQAVALRDSSWQRDVDGLIDSLRGEREPAEVRRRRRRAALLVSGSVALVVVAALVVTAVLIGRSGGHGSASSGPPVCPSEDGASFTTRSIETGRSASETLDSGGSLSFTVLGARERPSGAGHWQVLVRSRMGNGGSDSTYHEDWRYQSLAVDGTPFPVSCFSIVAGDRVVGPGLNSEAVVGFDVSKDPAGELSLVLQSGLQLPVALATG